MIRLLITLMIMGVLLWLFNTYVSCAMTVKMIINIVAIILMIRKSSTVFYSSLIGTYQGFTHDDTSTFK